MAITFEGLTPAGTFGFVPNGYEGFRWINTFVVDGGYGPGWKAVADAASPTAVGSAYLPQGDAVIRKGHKDDPDFTLESMVMGSAATNHVSVRIIARDDGVVTGSKRIKLDFDDPETVLFDSGFASVDSIRIKVKGNNSPLASAKEAAFDDVVLTYDTPSIVPDAPLI
jgi:hypothetical protein